ncbi:hypothetical protein ACQWHU_24815, partial [Salmonella enterica subsp. enterica serovar Infantis]
GGPPDPPQKRNFDRPNQGPRPVEFKIYQIIQKNQTTICKKLNEKNQKNIINKKNKTKKHRNQKKVHVNPPKKSKNCYKEQ